jgi:hypothetical protein
MRRNGEERYESVDDRRPIWARNGKLPVAHRRASLRLELAKHRILAYKSPEVTRKLGSCSLAELRRIHTYAAGGVQGSVNVRLEQASGSGTLVDAHGKKPPANIRKGEPFFSLDFRPYNIHHKNERGTAATYFLFQDLGLAIDALNVKDAKHPELIVSSTNATMARLAIGKAGFALHGARVETGNHVFEFGEQVAANILEGRQNEVLQAAHAEVELHAFKTTEDFLSQRTREDYARKAEFLQNRLALPGESPGQTEARLRTEAIQLCLTEMQATDALRLARYTYRRDLVEPADNAVLATAQQQIAAWQPQAGPEDFVLPDYYAK